MQMALEQLNIQVNMQVVFIYDLCLLIQLVKYASDFCQHCVLLAVNSCRLSMIW